MDEQKQPRGTSVTRYQIKLQGRLDERWSDWFNCMSTATDGDFTLLTGVFADQAKLRGILSKIWDLNLIVVSVNQIESTEDSSDKNEEVDHG
ncbi:MAG: hypothetical protein JXA78_17535 [Anaerolineales bacterium]|nr:hypothetical protein [Anaerolineales bacterium]